MNYSFHNKLCFPFLNWIFSRLRLWISMNLFTSGNFTILQPIQLEYANANQIGLLNFKTIFPVHIHIWIWPTAIHTKLSSPSEWNRMMLSTIGFYQKKEIPSFLRINLLRNLSLWWTLPLFVFISSRVLNFLL